MGPKKGKGKKEVKIKVKMPPKRPPGWKSFVEEEEEEEEEEDDEEEEEHEEEEAEDEEEEEVEKLFEGPLNEPVFPRKSSLMDIEGAVPKSTLRKLTNRALRQLIIHARKEIERYDAENYLFERTIEKLEKPEKDIDEMYHSSDSLLNAHDHAGPQVCSSESEDEPDETGEYVAIKPLDEIHISTDSFFDNMSDNSKNAAIGYFTNIGEIAPPNFDVMRFKYGDLVKGAPEDVEAEDVSVNVERKSKISPHLLEHARGSVDDKKDTERSKGKVKSPTASNIHITNTALGLATILGERIDEDQEYPGFSMATAKELSVRDKLRFALEEEEEFRNDYYKFETQALQEEGAVQVYIDAHKHSIRLLLTLRKEFKNVMSDARHPITGKLMAELILRFKRKMRNSIAAEDTKTRMTIRKIVNVKKRALHQLKTNKDSGNSISQIDFEHLMTENQIFHDEMEEMNLSLKYLKQLSGHFFQILKEDQDSIERLNSEDVKLEKEIDTKRKVMKNFDKTYNRYKNLIAETSLKMEDLKKKLSEYHAPQPLEYIHLKAVQYEMESDVATLQKKLDEVNLSLITARSTFAMYCKLLPEGDQTDFENENWLEYVKKEVADNNMMSMLDDDDDMNDPELPDAFKPKVGWLPAGMRKKSTTSGRPNTAKSGRISGLKGNKLPKTKSAKNTRYSGGLEYNMTGPST